MASSISNINIYTPFSSPFSRLSRPNRKAHCNVAKAMAAERKDNLDHLQLQTQPKTRASPAAPTGLRDRFPTAKTVQQMMDTMERMMDDPFAYNSTWRPRSRNGYSGGRTRWAIREGEDGYNLRYDMPGMAKNDVKLWIEDNTLVVKAEKNDEHSGNGEEWLAKSYGKYSSRIALPENVDFEKIKAEVKDGVLYIRIPKPSMTKKIIDINVE